ncbi:hypothetical protein ES703_109933 [subsurface metagenome]
MPNVHCVLDASALLKKYRPEIGSEIVLELFKRKDCAKHILNVTIPEVTGAFVRWRLDEEIKPDEREDLIDGFIKDIRLYQVVVHNITHRNIVKTDDVWTKSITPKPSFQPQIVEQVVCPMCGKSFEKISQRRKPRIGPVDVLVLSVCLALRASYGKIYLFSSDDHMLKVARRLNITICNPEVVSQLPF